MADEKAVFIGCDHAGLSLKNAVIEYLKKEMPHLALQDVGCHSEESVDYPDFAKQVAENVVKNKARGILVCGSGIGMTISANKVNGARAAQCWDDTSARLSREHNDANIICFGARLTGQQVAFDMCRTWLTTKFQGGRHEKRVAKIHALENGAKGRG